LFGGGSKVPYPFSIHKYHKIGPIEKKLWEIQISVTKNDKFCT
jgi:hypothetical protein